MLYFGNLEKGGHGSSYLTLIACCKLYLRPWALSSDMRPCCRLLIFKTEKRNQEWLGFEIRIKNWNHHSKSNMISRGPPFGPPFPDCQNTTSQCSLEQKINVKTFLEKFLVQIEFQCCLLLKIAIFNSRIWNFPKSGFAYRFQIKLDFFLKRIRH